MSPFLRRVLTAAVAVPVGAYGAYAVLFGVQPGVKGGPPIKCDTNADCPIETWVRRDGWLGCTATSRYDEIQVGKGYKPKLVWQTTLEDSADRSDYRFDTDGIKLNPDDHNDESKDLWDGNHEDAGKKRYRWRSRNEQPKGIHFDVKVRRTILGPVSIGCTAADPLIANAGN